MNLRLNQDLDKHGRRCRDSQASCIGTNDGINAAVATVGGS